MRHHLIGMSLAALMAGNAMADDRPVITIAVQQVSNSGSLEPLREGSNVGVRVQYSFYEPLIDNERQSPELGLKPGVAESWRRIDDKTLELTLRKGVKFHDGSELTAEDVAFSFGPYRMWGASQGAQGLDQNRLPPAEATGAARNVWPQLDRVEVIDKYTVRIVNKAPDLTLEGRVARISSAIASRKAMEAAPNWLDYGRKPVGTGPYKVVDFKNDQHLILDAHDEYWGGKPPVRQLRFVVVPEVASRVNGLLSGQYDFITDVPPDQIKSIATNAKYEVVGGPILNHRLLVFDKNHPQLQDVRIRQAITHAIDRKLIADTLFDGRVVIPKGLQWPFYAKMFHADWEVPAYDPDKARKLLKEAGYKGETIVYRVLNNYYNNQVPTAQILSEMFRDVGLNVEIKMVENWDQILSKATQRGMRDWSNSASFNDPVSSIVSQHCPLGGQQRLGEWANPAFNLLCTELEQSSNADRRRQVFREMLQIIERDDPGYTVLHQTSLFYGKRKDIKWQWSGMQAMDFRAENFRFPSTP